MRCPSSGFVTRGLREDLRGQVFTRLCMVCWKRVAMQPISDELGGDGITRICAITEEHDGGSLIAREWRFWFGWIGSGKVNK